MGIKYRFDTKIWKNVKQILNDVSPYTHYQGKYWKTSVNNVNKEMEK